MDGNDELTESCSPVCISMPRSCCEKKLLIKKEKNLEKITEKTAITCKINKNLKNKN